MKDWQMRTAWGDTFWYDWLLHPSLIVSAVRNALAAAVCRKKGHKWQDFSSCGPDSGDVHHVCRRCGRSHYKGLY